MRKVAALVLVVLLNSSLIAAAYPIGSGASSLASIPTAGGGATPTPSGTPAPDPRAVPSPSSQPSFVPSSSLPINPSSPLPGSEMPPAGSRGGGTSTPWWFERSLAPRPNTVNVSSETSILLFVRDGTTPVQMPTDADIAAGKKPVGFANNTTNPFNFAGKLFETTVGNQSINASNDLDLGIPNQTLQLFFDGQPLSVGVNVTTGDVNSPIPTPFHFANGTFSFQVGRFPDLGCGGHLFTVLYDVNYAGNNKTYYSSTSRDFRVYTTCETSMVINVDQNPIVVGQNATFFGALSGSKGEAVSGRPVQVLMDNKLLGLTGPGAFFDNVQVDGTTFFDDFEDLNNSHWNQSGGGVGTWTVGPLARPECPGDPLCTPPAEAGSLNLAGTGLSSYYGKGVDTTLISPPVDLTAPSVPNPTLRFFFWYAIAYDDLFEVAFSVDGGLTWVNHTVLSLTGASSGLVYSLTGANGPPQWDAKGIPLNYFIGAPALLIGFHFHSVDHTAITAGSGSFQFRFQIPFETEANYHTITGQFAHGIPVDNVDGVTVITDPDWDFAYQSTISLQIIRLQVQRLSVFAFNLTEEQKTGFRGSSLTVAGKLLDNMGQALAPDPNNPLEKILVHIEWDMDYNDPNDPPSILVDKTEADISTGAFQIKYSVLTTQPLGLHNVTFKFEGAKFYVNTTGLDVYRLMAHTSVTWPAEADRWVYRFHEVAVTCLVRVVKEESRYNSQVGDPVDGELVRLTWTDAGVTKEIPAGQVGVLTNSSGGCLANQFVAFDAELGRKLVTLTYEGSDVYRPLQSSTNWSVVSEVSITLDPTEVYKGSTLWLNGTVLDDRGVGVDKLNLQLFFNAEQISPTTTNSDGTYSVGHSIETSLPVGNKSLLIKFLGNPIYRANTTATNITVKAHTLIERTDHTQVIDRGRQLNVTAKIIEIYEGGVKGAPVVGEGVQIRILDRSLTVQISNSKGEIQFRSTVPGDLPWGEATLTFEYNGTTFFDASSNETLIVVRAQAVVTFIVTTFQLNGASFNISADTVHQQEELVGLLKVTDELGNALASGDVRLYYSKQSSPGVLAERFPMGGGIIDEAGRKDFNVTWDDISPGNRTLIGVYNGTLCQTFINPRTLCVRPGEGNITVRYEHRTPPDVPPNDTLLYVVLSAVGIILASAFYFFWYAAKRRQLQKMQRIIRRAADRLVAGNPYAQVIFDAYRALARFLQANGYLRRDSETFREFEVALRQALPIDAKSMDEFLSILEEARYSDHEIGEAQKDRALASLNAVKTSIEQVIIGGGVAMAPPVPMPQAPPPPPPPPAPPAPEVPSEPGAPPPT